MDHANIQSEIIVKQTKIIEQLRKEKEWLIDKVSVSYFSGYSPLASKRKQEIILDMQRKLNEKVRRYDNKGAPID